MEIREKPSSNKVIVAVIIFFVLGFFINLFLNYNQSATLDQCAPVSDEILKAVKINTQTLEENTKKLDDIYNRLKVLEDNSKNRK